VLGSEKYEAAAKVAEWQGLEPRHVADLLLRAAWCCVDEGDVEAERFFRRKAAWAFERSLDAFDGVAREERAVLTYLVGELWRRVGDPRLAREWFDRVPARWSTRRRSSGCSTPRGSSATARASGSAEAGGGRGARARGVAPRARFVSARAEEPVARVAEPRQDVALRVELAVERGRVDGHVGVGLG
jgi:hypothetical protein